MIIDFDGMEEKPVDGFKGGVGITNLRKFENELGKIIMGRLEPGATIGLHTHETNSEVIYIISGTADFLYDPEDPAVSGNSDQNPDAASNGSSANATSSSNCDLLYDKNRYETVKAGGCHYCPKGHSHSMINNGNEDIVFFAVVPEQ